MWLQRSKKQFEQKFKNTYERFVRHWKNNYRNNIVVKIPNIFSFFGRRRKKILTETIEKRTGYRSNPCQNVKTKNSITHGRLIVRFNAFRCWINSRSIFLTKYDYVILNDLPAL